MTIILSLGKVRYALSSLGTGCKDAFTCPALPGLVLRKTYCDLGPDLWGWSFAVGESVFGNHSPLPGVEEALLDAKETLACTSISPFIPDDLVGEFTHAAEVLSNSPLAILIPTECAELLAALEGLLSWYPNRMLLEEWRDRVEAGNRVLNADSAYRSAVGPVVYRTGGSCLAPQIISLARQWVYT